MSDPNLRAPVGRLSARRVGHGTGPSPGDERFEAFQSEQPPPSATAGQQPHASTAFDVVDVAEWCDEVDPLSLFSSEVSSPPRLIDDDVRPVAAIAQTAPVEPLPRISTRVGASPRVPVLRKTAAVAPARVGRRSFPSRATLGALAFVIGVGGGAAVVVMVGFGMQGGGEPASVTPVAASSASSGAAAIATAVARPEASLPAATEPREERTVVPAAAPPAAVRNADRGVAAAPAPVRSADDESRAVPTATVRAASEPSRPTTAAVPPGPEAVPSASAPSAALPAVSSRTISPEPASSGGGAAAPGIVATAGTLPRGATSPEPAPSGPSSVVTATAVIESVLSRYAAAFSARDVAAARAVWPGVNERGLVRAFESVEEQQFDLGECVITATPPRAVASCDGTARYVPKVGNKRVRSEPRHWTFRLEQQRDGWSIEAVDLR